MTFAEILEHAEKRKWIRRKEWPFDSFLMLSITRRMLLDRSGDIRILKIEDYKADDWEVFKGCIDLEEIHNKKSITSLLEGVYYGAMSLSEEVGKHKLAPTNETITKLYNDLVNFIERFIQLSNNLKNKDNEGLSKHYKDNEEYINHFYIFTARCEGLLRQISNPPMSLALDYVVKDSYSRMRELFEEYKYLLIKEVRNDG